MNARTPEITPALDHLDAMADAWAQDTNIAAIAAALALKGAAGPIESMLRQSFVEGAYRLYCRAVNDGVIVGPGDLP